MASTTVPEKLYVTVQYRKDTADGKLGFASPYTKDSAFLKRKKTQDEWAYGYGSVMEIDETNDTVSIKEVPKNAAWDKSILFMGKFQPQILKNEPVEGFEIAKSVRRYGWNGGGNVKWRITDPRGFDLEISSENFASIISCVDMEKGLIKGKCLWGRTGSNNVLLPENSEPYQEATARTSMINNKVSLKDVQIGDTVKVISSWAKDDDEFIYYGKMNLLMISSNSDTRVLTTYVLKDESKNQFYTVSSPKIGLVVNKLATPLTKDEASKIVTEDTSNGSHWPDFYSEHVALASYDKFDLTKVKLSLEETQAPLSINNWPMIGYYHRMFVIKHEDDICVPYVDYHKNLKLYKVTLTDSRIMRDKVPHHHRSYWGSSTQYIDVELTQYDPTKLKYHNLVVEHGDLKGRAARF